MTKEEFQRSKEGLLLGLDTLRKQVEGEHELNPQFMSYFLYVLLKISLRWGREQMDANLKKRLNAMPALFIPIAEDAEVAMDCTLGASDPFIHAAQEMFRILPGEEWVKKKQMESEYEYLEFMRLQADIKEDLLG